MNRQRLWQMVQRHSCGLLTVLVGLLAYSNSFHGPFVFDDEASIADNEDIKLFRNIWSPLPMRWFATLTFAINYRFGGLDTFGFHLVNFVIHCASALLVHRLVLAMLRTPFFSPAPPCPQPASDVRRSIACVSALVFVAHPIQTQAVTYIVQRYSSLAAMLYLLSLVLFFEWRLALEPAAGPGNGHAPAAGGSARGRLLYAGSLFAAVLAMKTKEIAFTAPIAVALFEALLFRGRACARVVRLLPLLATLLVIPLNLALLSLSAGSVLTLDRATRYITFMPRSVYLLTQFRVVVTYLRLLLFPTGQNLDHDFPQSRTFFDPAVYLSFAILIAVVAAGFFFAWKAARCSSAASADDPWGGRVTCGLIAFGIFWFFITLSVESSVIPLGEIIAENRLYLPSVGYAVAFSASLLYVVRRIAATAAGAAVSRLAPALAAALVVGILAAATHQRNETWRDKLSLSLDMVRKSPNSGRAHSNLGQAYSEQGLVDEAIAEYETALRLNPFSHVPHCNLERAYKFKGLFDKAAEHARICQWGRKMPVGGFPGTR